MPSNDLRSHLPEIIEACACGIFLARDSMSENVCSAVEMVLPPGVFITTMPRSVAALDVDVIDTDAGAADDLQPGRGRERLGGDFGWRCG